jgi:hypothetical protein
MIFCALKTALVHKNKRKQKNSQCLSVLMAVSVLLGQVFILKVLFKICTLYIWCAYMLVTLFSKLVRPPTLAPMILKVIIQDLGLQCSGVYQKSGLWF